MNFTKTISHLYLSYKDLYFNILSVFIGVSIGYIFIYTLSLPAKYSITFALGLIIAPCVIFIKNKERFFMGAFIFALTIRMGLKIIERSQTTHSSAKLLFQLYLSDVFLIVLIVFFIMRIFLFKNKSSESVWHTKIFLPLLLWVGIGFISLISAVDKSAVLVEIIRMSRYILAFFITFHFINKKKDVNFIINVLLFSVLVQSVLMVAQQLTNSLIINFPGFTAYIDYVATGIRPSGTMGLSPDYAKFSGIILPLAFPIIFFSHSFKKRIFVFSIWLFGSIALVLTVSRIGLATWFSSILFFSLGISFLKIVPARKIFALLLVCFLWVVIFSGFLFFIGGKNLIERINYDYGSAASRIPMARVAINIIKENPLTGIGLKNYTIVHQHYDDTSRQISRLLPVSPVHNLYLLIAAEGGILGLVFFLWFIFEFFTTTYRCIKKNLIPIEKAIYLSIAIGILSLLIQSFVCMGASVSLIHLSLVSILGGCVAKMNLLMENKKTVSFRE